jgi:tRNA(Ile)-lysidine synthase
LFVNRTVVVEYLTFLGQPHREDATNADLAFTRNRIRHELLPLLSTFNPQIVDVLGRLAQQADGAFAGQDDLAAGLVALSEAPRAGGCVVLRVEALATAADYLLQAVVRHVWRREGWPRSGMSFAHWRRLAGVVRGDPPAADFPDGVSARRVGKVVQIGRRE